MEAIKTAPVTKQGMLGTAQPLVELQFSRYQQHVRLMQASLEVEREVTRTGKIGTLS
jgi:hypothetical protein